LKYAFTDFPLNLGGESFKILSALQGPLSRIFPFCKAATSAGLEKPSTTRTLLGKLKSFQDLTVLSPLSQQGTFIQSSYMAPGFPHWNTSRLNPFLPLPCQLLVNQNAPLLPTVSHQPKGFFYISWKVFTFRLSGCPFSHTLIPQRPPPITVKGILQVLSFQILSAKLDP